MFISVIQSLKLLSGYGVRACLGVVYLCLETSATGLICCSDASGQVGKQLTAVFGIGEVGYRVLD
jgi:hypothetical protein